ncbi:DUF72 domain-containing protein [Pararhizobium mangrovi]|uniref:DUF72 domain-containing protein n=1 Tax=Pararhizobium mangrovi TaxID=2590452 RepID=A0A506UEK8_9HYPH|nr:DUF72 domain-containing protein [Pararhizobium mangrovi]TPW31315.1 DUF72 domain-containing protein [Pararhizobium mangrovi]
MGEHGTIRSGIGGWTFEPWEKTFYPEKLAKTKHLAYAAGKLSTIEINATYYRGQKPETFAKWAASVPEGFVFAVKGNRFVTNRKKLAEGDESLDRFFASGVTELGEKLGPILWQFAPTKKFEEADFEDFLKMLPAKHDGVDLSHAVEVRHESFRASEFAALLRRHGVAVVFADHATYPAIADVTGDFVYARLQRGSDDVETCYPEDDLDGWARRAKEWAEGGAPDDLAYADADTKPEAKPRDVFVYFIHEGKAQAPHGAMALAERTRA